MGAITAEARPQGPSAARSRSPQPRRVLVLSGGNALGAYAAGAYEALHDLGYDFDLISGASIGAVNGAIIAGNAFDERIPKLREFWTQAAIGTTGSVMATTGTWRQLSNSASAVQTLMFGRPGLFVPDARSLLPSLFGMPSHPALFDHRWSTPTLRRVIDFERLNAGGLPLIVTAVDAQTGQLVRFDTRRQALAPAHFLASTAMPPLYPPIAIDGRSFVDPGLVENLPLDPALDAFGDDDLLCIAVDAFSPNREALRDLGAAAERAQDILFSAQSRRTLEHLVERHRLRRIVGTLGPRAKGDVADTAMREASRAQLTIVRIAYRAPPDEVAAKVLDFSQRSIEERWQAGRADVQRALERLSGDESTRCEDGVTLYDDA